MAVPDVQRDGENESRLHRERLSSSRLPALDRASEAWGGQAGVMQGGGGQENAVPDARSNDQGTSAATRQQRLESQLQRTRRQEQEPRKEEKSGGGGAPSLRDATMLAKATPAGAVAGAAAGLATGRLSTEDIQRGVGRGCILMLWNSLWLTFGHTIYFIVILFLIASSSKYARKYFPEVGEEWIPSDLLKKISKAARIPIKMAEIVGIAFILFWVFMIDMACIGIIALLLAVIMSAVNFLP